MPQVVWYIVLPFVGIVLGWIIRWIYARFQLTASEQKAERVKQDAIREAEAQKKEILLNAKDELIRERNQQERENRERRAEIQRFEAKVNKKEELLEQRAADFEKSEKELAEQKNALSKREEALAKQEEMYRVELEKISGLSAQEAKELIIKNLENEARHDAQGLINKIEQEAQLTAEKKAKDVLITTIQRIAPEVTSDITVTTVSLPSDEMKGRIIGREGRNIRTLETLTGVDIIIDDTPEAVVISCFDPVRKEIAKESLERLISDGRIHPARIEEVVLKVTHEIQNKILLPTVTMRYAGLDAADQYVFLYKAFLEGSFENAYKILMEKVRKITDKFKAEEDRIKMRSFFSSIFVEKMNSNDLSWIEEYRLERKKIMIPKIKKELSVVIEDT